MKINYTHRSFNIQFSPHESDSFLYLGRRIAQQINATAAIPSSRTRASFYAIGMNTWENGKYIKVSINNFKRVVFRAICQSLKRRAIKYEI